MEAKQYATRQPMDHWINQRGNKKKLPRGKWKWKQDNPKPMGFSKSISKKRISSNANLTEDIRKISNKQHNFKFKV